MVFEKTFRLLEVYAIAQRRELAKNRLLVASGEPVLVYADTVLDARKLLLHLRKAHLRPAHRLHVWVRRFASTDDVEIAVAQQPELYALLSKLPGQGCVEITIGRICANFTLKPFAFGLEAVHVPLNRQNISYGMIAHFHFALSTRLQDKANGLFGIRKFTLRRANALSCRSGKV